MGTTVDYTVLLLYPDYLSSDFGQETFLAWVTTGQGLEDAVELARERATAAQPDPNAVLDFNEGLDFYTRDTSWRDGVIEHFRMNMQKLVALAQDGAVRPGKDKILVPVDPDAVGPVRRAESQTTTRRIRCAARR